MNPTNPNHKRPDTHIIDSITVAVELANMPQPELSPEARTRILARVHQALPPAQPAVRKVLRYPAQSALRLTACFAIFIFIMSQVGLPAIHDSQSIDLFYPIQYAEALKDIELVSIVFS